MSVCVKRCPAISGNVERILHRIGGTSVVESSGHAEVPPCQRIKKDVLQPSWQARESWPEAHLEGVMDAPLPTHLEKVFECIDPEVDRAIRFAKTLNAPKCGLGGVRVMEHAVRVDKIERTIGERQCKQTRYHRMNKLHRGNPCAAAQQRQIEIDPDNLRAACNPAGCIVDIDRLQAEACADI